MNNQAQPPYSVPGSAPLAFGAEQPPMTKTIGYTVPPPAANAPKKHGMLIALIIVSVFMALFLVLFIWALINYIDSKTDLDGKVNQAVAVAVNEKATALEADFAEREKSPYTTFAGPENYGSLTFQYPKTWSLYIAKDASSGGDYEAYLNPGAVNPVSASTINALRVSIVGKSYDTVAKTYESRIKNNKMSVSVRLINGENANYYTGELTNGQLVGAVAIFPIRDKTVILQTDANVFIEDFNRILDTVQYTK